MAQVNFLDVEVDERPGNYYVSCRNGKRWSLVYGPFGRHQDALDAVEMARGEAERADPWATFYAFGTARTADEWRPVGVLNGRLPAIREAMDVA